MMSGIVYDPKPAKLVKPERMLAPNKDNVYFLAEIIGPSEIIGKVEVKFCNTGQLRAVRESLLVKPSDIEWTHRNQKVLVKVERGNGVEDYEDGTVDDHAWDDEKQVYRCRIKLRNCYKMFEQESIGLSRPVIDDIKNVIKGYKQGQFCCQLCSYFSLTVFIAFIVYMLK